jgi:hypothetical protein
MHLGFTGDRKTKSDVVNMSFKQPLCNERQGWQRKLSPMAVLDLDVGVVQTGRNLSVLTATSVPTSYLKTPLVLSLKSAPTTTARRGLP